MNTKRNHKVLIFLNSERESNLIQQTFPKVKSLDNRRAEFTAGSHTCLTLWSDPGIFSASYYLTREIVANHFDLVINAGICGSYCDTYEIGTAVRVQYDVFADTGAEDGTTLFDLGLIRKDDFPFEKGELSDHPGDFCGIDQLPPSVRAVTVNRISQSPGNISFLKTKYRPDIESMEGAAVFYICGNEKLNFIQIRGISNIVGDRDLNDWEVEKAMNSVAEAVLKILE